MSRKAASPEEVLAALQAGATTRTKNSLNIIHAICAEQHKAGNRDFSVVTIGRLSSGRGGPSTQAIRNKTGEHYRTLLLAWASQADGAARKPPSKPATSLESEILDMIEDPCVCALVGSILAEIRHLRNENTVLKMSASPVIDRRPLPEARGTPPNPGAQLFSPLSLLLPLEVEALRFALSDQFLESMGWTLDSKTGRVSRGERAIFRAGFGTAIKKIVDAAKQ